MTINTDSPAFETTPLDDDQPSFCRMHVGVDTVFVPAPAPNPTGGTGMTDTITLNPHDHPKGTRVIRRSSVTPEHLFQDDVVEWSPKGLVRLNQTGWKDPSTDLRIVEVLP